jgi:ankyrin repeat protein
MEPFYKIAQKQNLSIKEWIEFLMFRPEYITLINPDFSENVDSSKRTLLHNAIFENNVPLFEALVDFKKNDSTYLNFRDITGHTALHMACLRGYEYMVKHPDFKLANLTELTDNGWTSLHCTAYSGNNDLLLYLLFNGVIDKLTYDGISALQIAKSHKKVECISLLLMNETELANLFAVLY